MYIKYVILLTSIFFHTSIAKSSDDNEVYYYNTENCLGPLVNGHYVYIGTKSVTVSGKTCQRWNSSKPHKPNALTLAISMESRSHMQNYCRTPDLHSIPWCYTMVKGHKWEECGIHHCKSFPILLSADKPTGTWGSVFMSFTLFYNAVDESKNKAGERVTCVYLKQRYLHDTRDIYVDLLQYANVSNVRFYFGPNCCEGRRNNRIDVRISQHLLETERYFHRLCGIVSLNKKIIDVECHGFGRVVRAFFSNKLAQYITVCELEIYGFTGIPVNTDNLLKLFQSERSIGCEQEGDKMVEKMTLYRVSHNGDENIVKKCEYCARLSISYIPTKMKPNTYYRCETLYKGKIGSAGPTEMRCKKMLISANKPTGSWRSTTNSFSDTHQLVDEPNKEGLHLFCTYLKKGTGLGTEVYIDLLKYAIVSRVRIYFDVDCCQGPYYFFDVKFAKYVSSYEDYHSGCETGIQRGHIVDVNCLIIMTRIVKVDFENPMVKICELEVYGVVYEPVDTVHTFRVFQTEDLIGCKEIYNRTVQFMELTKDRDVVKQCTDCNQIDVPANIANKTVLRCLTIHNGSRSSAGPTELHSSPKLLSANKPTGTWTSSTNIFDTHHIVDEPNEVNDDFKSCSWFYPYKYNKKDVYVDLLQYAELSRVRLYFGASCCEALQLIVKIGIHVTSSESYTECGSGTHNTSKVDVHCVGQARVVQVIFSDIALTVQICELEVFGYDGPPVDTNHIVRIFQTESVIGCMEIYHGKVEKMTLYKDDILVKQCSNCYKIYENYNNTEYLIPESLYRCHTLHKGRIRLAGPTKMRNGPKLLTSRNNPTGTWTSRTDCYNDIHRILDEPDKLTGHTSCTRLFKKEDQYKDLYIDLLQYAYLTSVRFYFGINYCESCFKFVVKIGIDLASSESYTDCGTGSYNRRTSPVSCIGHARVVQIIFMDNAPEMEICELQVFGFTGAPVDTHHEFRTFQTEGTFGCEEINYKYISSMALYKDDTIIKQCADCYKIFENRDPEKVIPSGSYFHCTTISTDGENAAGPTQLRTNSTKAINNKDNPILLSANKPTGTWTGTLDTFTLYPNHLHHIVDEPNEKGQHMSCLWLKKARDEDRDIYIDLLEYAELSRVRFFFTGINDFKFAVKIGLHLTSSKGYTDCGYGSPDKKIMFDMDCIGVARIVQVIFSDSVVSSIGICEIEVFGFTGTPADTNHTFRIFQTEDTIGCKEMDDQNVENMTLYKDDIIIVKQCTNCSQLSVKFNFHTKMYRTFYRCETLNNGSRGATGPIELGNPTFRIFQTKNSTGCQEMYDRNVESMTLYKNDSIILRCKNCSKLSENYNPKHMVSGIFYRCETMHIGSISTAGPKELLKEPHTKPPYGKNDCIALPTVNGRLSYNGTMNKTYSGKTCQRWDTFSPHTPDKDIILDFPWFVLQDMQNYCRVLQSRAYAWCYTMDEDKRWDYCHINPCDS